MRTHTNSKTFVLVHGGWGGSEEEIARHHSM